MAQWLTSSEQKSSRYWLQCNHVPMWLLLRTSSLVGTGLQCNHAALWLRHRTKSLVGTGLHCDHAAQWLRRRTNSLVGTGYNVTMRRSGYVVGPIV